MNMLSRVFKRAEVKEVTIRGIVVSGMGKGRLILQFDWVRDQIISKVGFTPFPGTLNLKLSDSKSLARFTEAKSWPAIIIDPPDEEHCQGKVFRALIGDRIEGAVVLPCVPSYPSDVAEVIAPVNLREALRLTDGDSVSLRLF